MPARPTRPVTIFALDPAAPYARLVVAYLADGLLHNEKDEVLVGLDAAPDVLTAARVGIGMRATLGVLPDGRPTYLVAGSAHLWAAAPDAGSYVARAFYGAPARKRGRIAHAAYLVYGLPTPEVAIAEAARPVDVPDRYTLISRDVLDLSKDERSGKMVVWSWYPDPDGFERRYV
jgi:hypothetical protein